MAGRTEDDAADVTGAVRAEDDHPCAVGGGVEHIAGQAFGGCPPDGQPWCDRPREPERSVDDGLPGVPRRTGVGQGRRHRHRTYADQDRHVPDVVDFELRAVPQRSGRGVPDGVHRVLGAVGANDDAPRAGRVLDDSHGARRPPQTGVRHRAEHERRQVATTTRSDHKEIGVDRRIDQHHRLVASACLAVHGEAGCHRSGQLHGALGAIGRLDISSRLVHVPRLPDQAGRDGRWFRPGVDHRQVGAHAERFCGGEADGLVRSLGPICAYNDAGHLASLVDRCYAAAAATAIGRDAEPGCGVPAAVGPRLSTVLLDHLLGALDVRSACNARDGVRVSDLAYDSRRVIAGTLYCCVRGATSDGHAHAAAAVAAGAVALVCEEPLPLDVPQAIVPDARAAMAPLADRFFGEPTRELRVAGVTGTNGKTTTAYLTQAVLETAGVRCGLLGTVEQRVGGVREPVERTTPEAIDLQRTFRRMLAAGDRACAMEVSSHALALGRVDCVRFAAGAFTNLSQDHLDFHGSMEAYLAAKALFFDGRCAATATNADDPSGRELTADLRFGTDAAVRAEQVVLSVDGTSFLLVTPGGSAIVSSRLRGAFNVSNALAAAALCHLLGVEVAVIAAGLESVAGVPGRLEPVEAGQPFAVLVDYAHTPDALETVLRAAREIGTGHLHLVFGCGGDRDRGKRPLMGEVAGRLADDVVVTSDNPRSEDPDVIIAEIVAGLERPATVEPDRRAAIALALQRARAGDVVVIAGKGHEQGQETAGVTIPFDDRVVAREALR